MVSLAAAATLVTVAGCAPSAQPVTAVASAGSASVRPVERQVGQEAGTEGKNVRAGAAGAAFGAAGVSTGRAAAGRCRTGELRARVGRVDAGAGQRYAPLVLTNTSAKDCWVYGFVGLVMFDGNGDALRTRVRRENLQPRRVTLRPGGGAHARIHWTVVPGKGESTCPSAARLMIIPPDEVAHLEIPFAATVCGDGRLDITPMAPGTRL